MSNRDSLGFGDLLPQDVVDIFAQEKLSKKGRKQRSRSLGRALGWLKGKKNKNVGSKGKNLGLGPAFDLALDIRPAGYQGTPKGTQKSGKQGSQQSNSHAVPKRDDNDENTPTPLVLQENVFIEVSRPKYLEDLHSEALEGLKLMQQEERIIGPEYQDNESTISSVSVRAEVDGGGFTTDSTLPDTSSTVSVQSSVSSRSSRSGLTRQGSTFRPLNSGKKSEKGRMRRRHRKTIGGIPQHLQREFGLDRAEWAVGPQLEEEFVNGDGDVPQLAVHSPPAANNTEVIHPLSSVQEGLLSAAQPAHVDDLALLQRLGPTQSGGDRPWSLAVPGMTTAGSGQPGPPSPVMSMSPQAAYLSKIIPNAVLPPSIEVVEISRGSSRNSVRTVSKSSLVLSSPTSSRASSRASTARSTSSRSSTITSASQHNRFHLSDSSCWSNSDSDTLVSDSSTISSSSTPHQREAQDKGVSKKQNKVSVHTDSPKYPSNGKIIKGNESKKDGPFVRSLSVMKPKRAPPPPSRSYSLHNKMKRRSRDLAEVKIIPSQTTEGNMKKIIDSPGYNADTSSLDESTGSKTPSPLKFQQNVDSIQINVSTDASNAKNEALQVSNHSKVISPSSGYSSQDTTSPKHPSPKHKKGLLAKLHKLFPASTAVDLPTNAVSQPEASKTNSASVSTVSDKPSVKALRDLFTIPPHPKVHAPPPPPPEVWSHSPRSIELLLGPPAPGNTYAIVKKNPKDKRPYRQPASTSTEGTVRGDEQEQSKSIIVESKKVHASQEGSLNVENRTNDCERLIQKNIDVKEHGKVQVSEILSSVLARTVDRDIDRLPVIAEEHKTSSQNTKNPSISSTHISPRLPIKQSADVPKIVSPESSWPPPPPPVSQVILGSPDETDIPLPPPPVFTEGEIVLPVQVPPDKPVSGASNVSISLQGNKAPPLNIPPPPSYTAPPPPSYTAPPPPIKTVALSEKVKPFSPQSKDVSPLPSKITLSPPKQVVTPPKISKPSPLALRKEISHQSTETFPSTPAQSASVSNPPPQKLSAIPPPPPQKLLLDILATKIIHTPTTKPISLSSNSEVPPPPDLIPPLPPKEVVVVPPIEADLQTHPTSQVSILLHQEVPPSAEKVTSESAEASPLQLVVTNVTCPPESEIITEVYIPTPKDITPPPQTVSTPPAEAACPSDTVKVSSSKPSPPLSEAAPPLAAVVLSPPVEVALIPPEILNPQPEEVCAPPQIEVTQPPVEIPASPTAAIQQPEDVTQTSVELSKPEVALPPIEMSVTPISSPQSPEVHSEETPTNAEVSIPSPEVSLPIDVLSPPLEVAPKPTEASPPEIVVAEPAEPQLIELPPSVVDERLLPIVVEVSYPELAEETSTDAVEDDSQKTSEEMEPSPPDKAPSVTSPDKDSDPKSEEPAFQKEIEPALQKEIELSAQETLNETNSTLPSWNSILTPPQSIPPPPPTEPPTSDTLPSHKPSKLEEIPSQPEVPTPTESSSPREEPDAILVPTSPIEVQEPDSDTAEHPSKQSDHAPISEEVSQIANPTTDQNISDSPESPKTQDEAKPQDKDETSNQAQTSATTEAPQKPIRRSLIISSPPSPPAAVTTPSPTIKGTSPNTSVTTTTFTKSPPAMAPSMNLQEAIRLRTAARSHNGPSSRLGLHSPPGFDVRKSPTSTASFIFSKSSKKVVIDTRSEAKAEKKTEGSVTTTSAEHTMKKEFKVPPPVAKKPKTKAKEVESGDMEQTAGQDTQSEHVKDNTKKPNGNARTVEGH